MRRLLGDDAVAESDGGVVLSVPSGQSIHLDKADTAGLTAMTLRVADVAATAELFNSNEVSFDHDLPGSIITSASDACGTTLKFSESS
jgi:hypothetical protein